MKGMNELRLNTSTLIDILQDHFDRQCPALKIEVRNVMESSVSGSSWFVVTVAEKGDGQQTQS